MISLNSLRKQIDPTRRGKTFPHEFVVYQELECVTTDNGRHYVSPNGVKLTSVTTMLGRSGDKGWLEAWVDKLGVEAAELETQRCADRGEGVHLSCELYLRNELMEKVLSSSGSYQHMFLQLRPFLDKIGVVKALEIPLYSETLGLAGRVDCIAFYQGVLYVIDFKTSNKIKTRGMIQDYAIQLCLYSMMYEEMFGERINKLVNFISNENHPTPTILEFDRKDVIHATIDRVKLYREMEKQNGGNWTK